MKDSPLILASKSRVVSRHLFNLGCFISILFTAPLCAQEIDATQQLEQEPGVTAKSSLLTKRFESDRTALTNAFSITQFQRNYILPYSHVTNPNSLGNEALTSDNIDNNEAKFQLSIKLPLYNQEGSVEGLYFGFTLTSFWQLYNSEVSKPFRETNYEPEVFYQWNTDIRILGFEFNALQLGFNHMSNGQSGIRSRSWNRVTLTSLFSDEDDVYYLKTWYRIPEDEKVDVNDTSGDDNPDMSHYYGRLEIGYGTRLDNWGILLRFRNNLEWSKNRGSAGISISYPVSPRYEVVLDYFNGYGDSLIDYNRKQERIGIGFQLVLF